MFDCRRKDCFKRFPTEIARREHIKAVHETIPGPATQAQLSRIKQLQRVTLDFTLIGNAQSLDDLDSRMADELIHRIEVSLIEKDRHA